MKRHLDVLRVLDAAALPVGLAIVAFVLLRIHLKIYPNFEGWFAGFDQAKYRLAAQAWSHGDLSPGLHYYPPGYSLFAAPFVWLLPAQPFAIPNAAFLAGSLILFVMISRRLVPDAPGWRTGCVAAFLAGCLGTATLRQIWTIPWNSTAATPFTMAALLATLRLCEAPSWRRAAMLGCLLGVLAGIRPTDAMMIAPCCALYAAWRVLSGGSVSYAVLARLTVAGLGGLVAGAAPFVAAHVAINGWALGFYLTKSAGLGFEWRLLALRWVTIVLDPRPLLPEGLGLAEGLPWIAPGLAGLVFLMMASWRQPQKAWCLIAACVAVTWAGYLCYRDLQPYGIWRFYNLHYFKWSFSFLALSGLRLIVALMVPGHRRLAALAVCAAIPLLIWQPAGILTARLSGVPAAGQDDGIAVAQILSGVTDAVFLPVQGSWRDIYFKAATLSADGKIFRNTRDFKLQPVAGGALLQPLRILPDAPLVFRPGPDTHLDAAKSPAGISEKLRIGLPCGILPKRAACVSPAY